MNGKLSSMRALCLGRSLIVCLLLWTAGCASKGTISGKVFYMGKPLPGGTVTFFPAGKGAFPAPIQEDGSYSLAQVPAGEAKITVETVSMNPGRVSIPETSPFYREKQRLEEKMQMREYREEMEKMKTLIPKDQDIRVMMMPCLWVGDPEKYVRIPEYYLNPEKSGLTYTVIAGEQTHDIEMK